MLARFDLINLLRDVNSDDSFYYFQIAFNLAEGKFSTFDGGITRTNGYHPLWLFLITPFYWVFDKETALFAIKAFKIMLVAGSVALVTAAARLARMPWYLMFAALPILYQRHALISGMEAAAALFMLGLFILTTCLFARSPARWQWPLAAVAFALPWVRLEYIAISLAVTAALCLVERSWQESPSPQPFPVEGEGEGLGAPEARGGWFLLPLWEKARMRGDGLPPIRLNAVVPLLSAIAGIMVYFAYNQFVFGGIVPVSGAIKAALSQLRWERHGGYSLAQNFREILQLSVFNYELLVALEVCAYLLLVWWFTRRSHNREDRLLLVFLAGVSGLAVGHLAKFGQTVLTVHPHFGDYNWYFVPAYLMMALIIPVRCYVAIHFVRRFVWPRWPQAANVLIVGIIAAAIFLPEKADFAAPFRFVDRASESTSREWEVTSYMGTQVMDRLLPEDSVVGSWDAGPPIQIGTAPADSIHHGDHLYLGEQVLARFKDGFDGWLLEGEAITNHSQYERYKGQQPISGNMGRGFLTSFHPENGDRVTGRALSPAFTAESGQYLIFLIAGGGGSGVGLRLLADGDEAAVWRGETTERFKRVIYPLAEVAGQRLQLELFDNETGSWGHIMLDHVMLARRNAEALQ